jgi:hypothetical protein
VFDVLGEEPDIKEELFQYHNQSTVPIVRFQKNEKKSQEEDQSDSDDSSSEADDNLFLEFEDSSDEMQDHEMFSTTTA